MNTSILRRFPLVARPRPACTPLTERVADLQQRATMAQATDNVSGAVAVFNLSALLASDCGLPDLARTWCHRLANATLEHHDPQHGLEAIVNLARLHTRAGSGTTAWNLLEQLFHAVNTRTDTIIDGLTIPAARLTTDPNVHARLRTWLWTVLLGTGAHALAAAERWDEASRYLAQYNGVGNRMFDGRQITVIAHAVAGRQHQARALVDSTRPGAPSEKAVTATLSLLLATGPTPHGHADAALAAYRDLGPADNGLAVFRTRLGLTLLDALGADHPAAPQIIAELIRDAAADGYAARDIAAHTGCHSVASPRQISQLVEIVKGCGLDAGTIAETQLPKLAETLTVAETMLIRTR